MNENKRKLEPNELWEEEKGWHLPKQKHKASSVSPELSRKRVPSCLLHAMWNGPCSDLNL